MWATMMPLPCSSYGSFRSKFAIPQIGSTTDEVYSGAWIVFPTYLLYVVGVEILEGLEVATGEVAKKTQ